MWTCFNVALQSFSCCYMDWTTQFSLFHIIACDYLDCIAMRIKALGLSPSWLSICPFLRTYTCSSHRLYCRRMREHSLFCWIENTRNTLGSCECHVTTVMKSHDSHASLSCLQSGLASVLSSCSISLSTIHQEISTPLMQGESNFKVHWGITVEPL